MHNKLLKLLLLVTFCIFLTNCSDDPTNPIDPNPDAELFMRPDAGETIIPLLIDKEWRYKVMEHSEGTPDNTIRNLLFNDRIVDSKILPIRKGDNNTGTGLYEYQALCYISEQNTVFFYMDDRILVGRYLESDANGYESAIGDFELPTHCTETSSRYFLINRNVSIDDPNANLETDFLKEMPGYHTIDVEGDLPDVKRYTDCKLFIFNNKPMSGSEITRINKFYFKAGVGLVRYQQFVKINDAESMLYEQSLQE